MKFVLLIKQHIKIKYNMSHPKIGYFRNKIKELSAHLIMDNDVEKLIGIITKDNVNNVINLEYGYTVLDIAIITHANNVIKYLIEQGADIEFKQSPKLNPSELAYRYNNEYFLELYRNSYKN